MFWSHFLSTRMRRWQLEKPKRCNERLHCGDDNDNEGNWSTTNKHNIRKEFKGWCFHDRLGLARLLLLPCVSVWCDVVKESRVNGGAERAPRRDMWVMCGWTISRYWPAQGDAIVLSKQERCFRGNSSLITSLGMWPPRFGLTSSLSSPRISLFFRGTRTGICEWHGL